MRAGFRVLAIAAAIAAVGFGSVATAQVKWRAPTPDEQKLLKLPLGLDPDQALVPANNPITADKIELGRALYFDVRLSESNTIACATCHHPRTGYTDGQPVSLGIGTLKGGRSAPTVINRLFSKEQFWDGRVPSLEEQAKGPITNPIEMGVHEHADVVRKLNGIQGYKAWNKKVFGAADITLDHIADAIATFERTVVSGNSPFDRYNDGDAKAMSASAARGLAIFKGKANCAQCHSGVNLSDEKYHNLGTGWDGNNIDLGQYAVTKKPEDIGKFKTPTLRDIANTGPYMHNGSLATLRQVIDFYDRGGNGNPFLDKDMKKLGLSEQEKEDLEDFLLALNGVGWQDKVAPRNFPR